ncbi:MAG: M23 family metallopeptidase [Pseudomonadota bacterium]
MSRGRFSATMACVLAALSAACSTATLPALSTASDIPLVTIHPPFASDYSCAEHWEGQLKSLGDALGTDCYATQVVPDEDGRSFARAFSTDGRKNEDWLSWRAPVLAPVDGKVIRIIEANGEENRPGFPGKPPATFVVFENASGVRVLIAHLNDISVEVGDTVTAGQPFAVVGNNGFSRSPHVHIGAWKGTTPYQIRHDLKAKAELRD